MAAKKKLQWKFFFWKLDEWVKKLCKKEQFYELKMTDEMNVNKAYHGLENFFSQDKKDNTSNKVKTWMQTIPFLPIYIVLDGMLQENRIISI